MTFFIPKGTTLYRTVENGWPCSGWKEVVSVRDVRYNAAEKRFSGVEYYVFQLPSDVLEWAQFAVRLTDVRVSP